MKRPLCYNTTERNLQNSMEGTAAARRRGGIGMSEELFALLDTLQEAALALRDGTVIYANAKAKAHFPFLGSGGELPGELRSLRPGETVSGSWGTAAASFLGAYTVLILRCDGGASGRAALSARSIRSILGSMNLACTRLEQGAEDREKYVAILNRSLYRLLRLCEHLELLGSDGGKGSGAIRTFDLAAAVRDLAGAVEIYTGRSPELDLPRGEILFRGVREDVQRLVLNLLTNALKYTPDGTIRISLREADGGVRITVSDEGTGMEPAAMLSALSGPDAEPEAVPDPGSGTGLGLAAARAVAARYGGTILLQKRPGGGLTAAASLRSAEGDGFQLRDRGVPYRHREMDVVLEELSELLDWKYYKTLHGD